MQEEDITTDNEEDVEGAEKSTTQHLTCSVRPLLLQIPVLMKVFQLPVKRLKIASRPWIIISRGLHKSLFVKPLKSSLSLSISNSRLDFNSYSLSLTLLSCSETEILHKMKVHVISHMVDHQDLRENEGLVTEMATVEVPVDLVVTFLIRVELLLTNLHSGGLGGRPDFVPVAGGYGEGPAPLNAEWENIIGSCQVF